MIKKILLLSIAFMQKIDKQRIILSFYLYSKLKTGKKNLIIIIRFHESFWFSDINII